MTGCGVRGLASPLTFLGAMVGMDQKDRCSDLFQARLSLRGSGVRVHFRARWCADTSLWAAIVLSLSVVLVLVCLCADTLIGQGLRSRSPWLVLVFIAVFGYGDVGKDCALALLGLVLVFIPVVAQRQLPWSAYSADHRDCPVAAH